MLKLLTKNRLFALLLVFALVIGLAGCEGDDGDDGAQGLQGPAGTDGSDGTDGTDGTEGTDGREATGLALDAAKPLTISNLVFGENADGFITATFDAASGTVPVTGMTASVTSIAFTGLLPGTAGASDEWKYWGTATDALIDNSAGNYTLTTDKKVADAPAGTTAQRSLIQFNNGAAYERANAVYDFLTTDLATQVASGKEVVNDASCKECHGYGVTIHAFGRNDTRACVVCHSPEYSATMAPNEADMVTMIHQIHSGKAEVLGNLHWNGHGDGWGIVGTGDNAGKIPVAELTYPMLDNMLNCDKCHNTVAQADNWKNKPTQAACDSCHTTIKFDGSAYTGINGGPGETHPYNNNSACVLCHSATKMATDHTPAANRDASQRPVEATISGVTVDADGGVTVAFSVTENGVAKTDVAEIGTNFTLAKLIPSTPGTPSYWQSYLSKIRTKDSTKAPVVQGRNEAVADGGILTNNGDGTYTYKFALLNADTFNADGTGDIRTISHAHNNSSAITGDYLPANGLTQMVYPVAYEPNLTHRVALSLTGIKTQPSLDFVPAGGDLVETRNIVTRESCNKCHGTSQLHAGVAVEYCVGCHNQNSFDPFSGPTGLGALAITDPAELGTQTVELGTIVHKIHMGRFLPSVQEGGSYVINGTHDYTKAQYPGGLPAFNPATNTVVPLARTNVGRPADCMFCHDEGNAAMTEAANWRIPGPACGNCHDGAADIAHIGANSYNGSYASCVICHGPGTMAPVEDAHYGRP